MAKEQKKTKEGSLEQKRVILTIWYSVDSKNNSSNVTLFMTPYCLGMLLFNLTGSKQVQDHVAYCLYITIWHANCLIIIVFALKGQKQTGSKLK